MDSSSALIASLVSSLVVTLIGVGYYVWYAVALSKVFGLLGAERWKAWVPILNEAELFVRGGVPGWSVVFLFLPIVQLYGLYLRGVAAHRINGMFGRGAGMTALALLLPPVWATVLGMGGSGSRVSEHTRIRGVNAGVAPIPAPPLQPVTLPANWPVVDDAAPAAPPASVAPPVVRSFAPPPVTAPEPVVVSAPPATSPSAVTPPAPFWTPAQPAARTSPPPAPAVVPPPDLAVAMGESPQSPAAALLPEPSIRLPEPPVVALRLPDPPVVAALKSEPEPQPVPEPGPVPAWSPAPELDDEVDGSDEDDDEIAATVVVDRRPAIPWRLHVEGGRVFALTGEQAVLGRKPAITAPNVQRIAVPDSTRTLSKEHARLDLAGGVWTVTDLHATNGVIVLAPDGSERLLEPGASAEIVGGFVLGKVAMRITDTGADADAGAAEAAADGVAQ